MGGGLEFRQRNLLSLRHPEIAMQRAFLKPVNPFSPVCHILYFAGVFVLIVAGGGVRLRGLRTAAGGVDGGALVD
jgi:hypothetical protein